MESLGIGGNAGRNLRGAPPPAIESTGLTKEYREVTAVECLDLTVAVGEIYGFLGRNGAGKTTTIRMLVGLIRPTRGRALIFGTDIAVRRREALRSIGSLVETATAYSNLTVQENLEMHRSLTQSPPESVERAIELLGLSDLADRRAGRLSLGNRQRLALARAILPRPRLLILDEPANALDPAGIVETRRLLRALADEEGVTVFVSSHILAEVAQLADRIGIIHHGRLIDEIDMRTEKRAARLSAAVSDAARAAALVRDALGVEEVTVNAGGTIEFASRDLEPAKVARLLVESGFELHSLSPMTENLEARFLRLTGDER